MKYKIITLLLFLSIIFCVDCSLAFQYNAFPNLSPTLFSPAMEPGGNGYPNEVIDWININHAYSIYNSCLRYNWVADRIAVLDSGLDETTWTYFRDIYDIDLVLIQLVDRSGNYLSRQNAYDDHPYNHGSAVVSLIINLLETQSYNVEMSLTMFMVTEPDTIYIDTDLVKQQLQRIINWNNAHSVGKYKVVSMSFGAENLFSAELYTLYQQGCIIVAASGNVESPYDESQYENVKLFPATNRYVIGSGGIYGYPVPSTSECYRMSTKYSRTTGGIRVGSCYWQNEGLRKATVNVVAPAFKVEVLHDYVDNPSIPGPELEYTLATGTSLSAPQVAVAAYLAARAKHYKTPQNPLNLDDFLSCLIESCENDPDGFGDFYYEEVAEPSDNLGAKPSYYSYRVGYGALDIYDLIKYVVTMLS